MSDVERPLFPLSTPLYPRGWLPLRIFELRYLDMINRAWREGLPFVVVGLIEGGEVARPVPSAAGGAGATGGKGGAPGGEAPTWAPERFHTLGTLAHVRELQAPQPGLLMVHCEGTQRVRISQPRRGPAGLWLAHSQALPPDVPLPVPPDLASAREALRELLHELRQQLSGGPASATAPYAEADFRDDCAWVAHRWAELLPLQAQFKQQVLATDSPLLRLELVDDVLDLMRRGGSPAERKA
jgi:uncharacterized protein